MCPTLGLNYVRLKSLHLYGIVVIAAGSEVKGTLEAAGRGVRFIADEIRFDGGNRTIPLNATSRLITTTETVRKGAKTQFICF